jgi:outer membrane protein assembly factor BamB
MFHVKQDIDMGEDPQTPSKAAPVAPRISRRVPRRPLATLAVATIALLAVACGGAAGSRGWASPVKTDSYLMVSARGGELNGLDPSTREEKWVFPQSWQLDDSGARDLDGIYGDPVVARDGTVYLGDYNGRVYVFRPGDFNANASDKPRAGAFDLKDPIIGGIALDESNNLLYVTAGKALYSVNTRDLLTRIQNKDASVKLSKLLNTGGDLWSAPLFANGKVYVGSLDGNLYAVDPSTGNEEWRFSTGKGVVTRPELNSGTIYAGGFGGKLYAVDASTGKEKWSFKGESWIWSKPVINSGTLNVGDFEGNLYALDASSGDLKWKHALGHGAIRSAVAVSGSTIVVASEPGWIAGISSDGNDKRWETKLSTLINADLVLSGDTVLIAPRGCVTNNNEKMYYVGINPSDGKLTEARGVC